MLERYHWHLDNRRRNIAQDCADKIAKAALHLPTHELLLKTSGFQKEMEMMLVQIDQQEESGNVSRRVCVCVCAPRACTYVHT